MAKPCALKKGDNDDDKEVAGADAKLLRNEKQSSTDSRTGRATSDQP